MRISLYLLLTAFVAVLATGMLLPNTASGQEAPAPAPKYVGVDQCKICHTGEAKGKIFEIWLASAHSKAWDNLGAENQKNDKCLGCHTTGAGKALAAGKTADNMHGVQCEACHGPGSDYKSMTVMKNKEEAIKKGLVMPPTEKVCTGCHMAELPKDVEAHAKAPKFVYADFVKKIEHHVPPKPATP